MRVKDRNDSNANRLDRVKDNVGKCAHTSTADAVVNAGICVGMVLNRANHCKDGISEPGPGSNLLTFIPCNSRLEFVSGGGRQNDRQGHLNFDKRR